MAAGPELVQRYKRELAECLAAEVVLWEAKSRAQAKLDLQAHGGRQLTERTHCGAVYNLVIDLLSESEEMLTILIDIQPDDTERIEVIAVLRLRTSGGWTDEEMGMISALLFLRE